MMMRVTKRQTSDRPAMYLSMSLIPTSSTGPRVLDIQTQEVYKMGWCPATNQTVGHEHPT